jgi:hypothetical protein
VLSNLNVILPVGIQGSSDVSINLVSVDGAILAEARNRAGRRGDAGRCHAA